MLPIVEAISTLSIIFCFFLAEYCPYIIWFRLVRVRIQELKVDRKTLASLRKNLRMQQQVYSEQNRVYLPPNNTEVTEGNFQQQSKGNQSPK